eukprot:Hpha_TRINITY_DN16237_c1_g3::TRINITY_DN16237_c1_g3_i2::g.16512::m.16512
MHRSDSQTDCRALASVGTAHGYDTVQQWPYSTSTPLNESWADATDSREHSPHEAALHHHHPYPMIASPAPASSPCGGMRTAMALPIHGLGSSLPLYSPTQSARNSPHAGMQSALTQRSVHHSSFVPVPGNCGRMGSSGPLHDQSACHSPALPSSNSPTMGAPPVFWSRPGAQSAPPGVYGGPDEGEQGTVSLRVHQNAVIAVPRPVLTLSAKAEQHLSFHKVVGWCKQQHSDFSTCTYGSDCAYAHITDKANHESYSAQATRAMRRSKYARQNPTPSPGGPGTQDSDRSSPPQGAIVNNPRDLNLYTPHRKGGTPTNTSPHNSETQTEQGLTVSSRQDNATVSAAATPHAHTPPAPAGSSGIVAQRRNDPSSAVSVVSVTGDGPRWWQGARKSLVKGDRVPVAAAIPLLAEASDKMSHLGREELAAARNAIHEQQLQNWSSIAAWLRRTRWGARAALAVELATAAGLQESPTEVLIERCSRMIVSERQGSITLIDLSLPQNEVNRTRGGAGGSTIGALLAERAPELTSADTLSLVCNTLAADDLSVLADSLPSSVAVVDLRRAAGGGRFEAVARLAGMLRQRRGKSAEPSVLRVTLGNETEARGLVRALELLPAGMRRGAVGVEVQCGLTRTDSKLGAEARLALQDLDVPGVWVRLPVLSMPPEYPLDATTDVEELHIACEEVCGDDAVAVQSVLARRGQIKRVHFHCITAPAAEVLQSAVTTAVANPEVTLLGFHIAQSAREHHCGAQKVFSLLLPLLSPADKVVPNVRTVIIDTKEPVEPHVAAAVLKLPLIENFVVVCSANSKRVQRAVPGIMKEVVSAKPQFLRTVYVHYWSRTAKEKGVFIVRPNAPPRYTPEHPAQQQQELMQHGQQPESEVMHHHHHHHHIQHHRLHHHHHVSHLHQPQVHHHHHHLTHQQHHHHLPTPQHHHHHHVTHHHHHHVAHHHHHHHHHHMQYPAACAVPSAPPSAVSLSAPISRVAEIELAAPQACWEGGWDDSERVTGDRADDIVADIKESPEGKAAGRGAPVLPSMNSLVRKVADYFEKPLAVRGGTTKVLHATEELLEELFGTEEEGKEHSFQSASSEAEDFSPRTQPDYSRPAKTAGVVVRPLPSSPVPLLEVRLQRLEHPRPTSITRVEFVDCDITVGAGVELCHCLLRGCRVTLCGGSYMAGCTLIGGGLLTRLEGTVAKAEATCFHNTILAEPDTPLASGLLPEEAIHNLVLVRDNLVLQSSDMGTKDWKGGNVVLPVPQGVSWRPTLGTDPAFKVRQAVLKPAHVSQCLQLVRQTSRAAYAAALGLHVVRPLGLCCADDQYQVAYSVEKMESLRVVSSRFSAPLRVHYEAGIAQIQQVLAVYQDEGVVHGGVNVDNVYISTEAPSDGSKWFLGPGDPDAIMEIQDDETALNEIMVWCRHLGH